MSAIQDILSEVDSRLQTISKTNGDAVNIRAVSRAKLTPFRDGDLPALNYWATDDAIEARDMGSELHALSIIIEAYDRTRDRPFLDVSVELYESVVAAIFRTTQGIESPSLGGLVQHLQIDSMQSIIGEGQAPYCGAIIELTIRYRTALGKTELL